MKATSPRRFCKHFSAPWLPKWASRTFGSQTSDPRSSPTQKRHNEAATWPESGGFGCWAAPGTQEPPKNRLTSAALSQFDVSISAFLTNTRKQTKPKSQAINNRSNESNKIEQVPETGSNHPPGELYSEWQLLALRSPSNEITSDGCRTTANAYDPSPFKLRTSLASGCKPL